MRTIALYYWQKSKCFLNKVMLRFGTKMYMIFVLATLALLDAFVPVTANFFVLMLAILQPMRSKLIVFVFAVSAGVSSFLFSLILAEFTEFGQWFGIQVLGVQWEQAQEFVRNYGSSILIFLAIFPDIPRTSIAVILFSGVDPLWIGVMVFLGKVILYSFILVLMNYLPERFGKRQLSNTIWQRWLQRKLRRFQAYRRRLSYLVLNDKLSI